MFWPFRRSSSTPNVNDLLKKRDLVGLTRILKNKAQRSWWAKTAAALGRLGDPAATSALLAALFETSVYSDDRAELLKALGAVGDHSALEPLKRFRDDQHDPSAKAAVTRSRNRIESRARLAASEAYQQAANPFDELKRRFSALRLADPDERRLRDVSLKACNACEGLAREGRSSHAESDLKSLKKATDDSAKVFGDIPLIQLQYEMLRAVETVWNRSPKR